SFFFFFFFSLSPRPPTSTLFPYTTLFRSCRRTCRRQAAAHPDGAGEGARRVTRWRLLRRRTARAVRPRPGRHRGRHARGRRRRRSEEHTSELQSRENLVCRLLLEKKKKKD